VKNAFNFVFKAFFGGCFGCLGVMSLLLVVILIVGLVFGSSMLNGITTFLQSIPAMVTRGLSGLEGEVNGEAPASGSVPIMEVYLTNGDDPSTEHINEFSSSQYEQVRFWVRAPQGTSTSFTLLLTMPDRSQVQFGPEFSTDPSGEPVSCGHFGDQAPSAGDYKLEVMVSGNSASAGSVEFTVMD
jgi:hypothetical protein